MESLKVVSLARFFSAFIITFSRLRIGKCSSQCYVNDTKLLVSFHIQNKQSVISDVNYDLFNVRNWYFRNHLLLNSTKTKLMVFGSSQLLPRLQDFSVSTRKRYPSYSNGQGLRCDPYLSYDEHIINTFTNCMCRLGQINRDKHAFDNRILLTILNTLVISKLYYVSNVWVNTSGNNIQKLQAGQNFACRITSGIRTRNYDHITPFLKELTWLTIASELFYRSAIMAFKCMSSKTPWPCKMHAIEPSPQQPGALHWGQIKKGVVEG